MIKSCFIYYLGLGLYLECIVPESYHIGSSFCILEWILVAASTLLVYFDFHLQVEFVNLKIKENVPWNVTFSLWLCIILIFVCYYGMTQLTLRRWTWKVCGWVMLRVYNQLTMCSCCFCQGNINSNVCRENNITFSVCVLVGVYSYLESRLQELSAGDDVGNLRLIQPVSNGWTSQCGVKGNHCNTQP